MTCTKWMFVTALVIAGAVFGCNRSEKRRDDGDQGSTGDARTRALKRDWRNVGLGMSVEQAKKAASELGFVGAADCDPTEHVSRFDPELPGFEFSPTAGVSLPQCRFESPEQQKLSAQTKDLNMENRDEVAAMVLANKTATGVYSLRLTFVEQSLYSIDVRFMDGEGMDGIRTRMEEAFGVPSTRTPLRERYLDGEHGWKVNDYGNGALWVDAHTAIMLYEDRMGLQARYFDLDQVAALDAADTLKRARDAIERNKKTSNTQF